MSNKSPKWSRHLNAFFSFVGYVVVVTIVIAVSLELAARGVLLFSHRSESASQPVAANPAYDGYPWTSAVLAEEQQRWSHAVRGTYQPFLIWGVTPWHGRFVNTDQIEGGIWRRTANPTSGRCADPNAHRFKVWLFGGSTVFGTGIPDFATVASTLSRSLNSGNSDCFYVVNMGVEGYVSNQELLLLGEELKKGLKPDIAVFYDGVNDAYAGAFAPGIPTAHLNLDRISARVEGRLASKIEFLDSSYALRLARRALMRSQTDKPTAISDSSGISQVKATIDNYCANMSQIKALAVAYGFKAYFFWQPAFWFGTKPLVPFERKLSTERGNEALRSMHAVYEAAEQRSQLPGSGFVFLGHIFDSNSAPLYLDSWMHLGQKGNEIVGERLAGEIRAQLR